MVAQSGASVVEIPMKEMAKAIPDGRPNMIALGIASRLLGFTVEQVFAPIEKHLADKGPAAIQASRAGIMAGIDGWHIRASSSAGDSPRRTERRPQMAAVRERGDRARRNPWWHSLCRRLSDHPSNRKFSNGSRQTLPKSAGCCCKPRTNSPQST